MINSKKQVFLGVPKPTTYHFGETSKHLELWNFYGAFHARKGKMEGKPEVSILEL